MHPLTHFVGFSTQKATTRTRALGPAACLGPREMGRGKTDGKPEVWPPAWLLRPQRRPTRKKK